ncbi:hypothetical protein D3C76_1080700 [compost metagenome]
MQTFDPIFPSELEMGNGADHVGPQLECLFQQGLAVGIGEDPLLREGDDLQLDPGFHLLAHLQHGFQSHQVGVGDIHMGANELDAVDDLPLQRLYGPPLHILMGQQRLAFGPALYPLEQGTGEVPARLTGGLGSIEVNVGLDKGGHRHPLLPIQFPGGEEDLAHGGYGPDQTILTQDLPQPLPATQTHILYQHVPFPLETLVAFANPQLSSDQFNRKAFTQNADETDIIEGEQR